jgi:hypothetical protein
MHPQLFLSPNSIITYFIMFYVGPVPSVKYLRKQKERKKEQSLQFGGGGGGANKEFLSQKGN